MASLKSIQLLAGKLGFENQDKLISKAAEFERLLQNKSLAGSSITDTGKVVICLELAAMYFGVDIDVKTAVKYSGLKSPTYMQSRKIIENLLELNSGSLSVSSLCLSLQCPGAQALAESILKDYEFNSKMTVELDLPQYVCMAVYQACRLKKIKVSKAKLIEKARLKSSQWAKLDADWTKFVDVNFGPANKKTGRTSKKVLQEEQQNVDKMEVEHEKSLTEIEDHPVSYEDWKRRILTAAYAELKSLEKQSKSKPKLVNDALNFNEVDKAVTVDSKLKLTPQRRSPRKTPLKYSPYKVQESPKKSQTVTYLDDTNAIAVDYIAERHAKVHQNRSSRFPVNPGYKDKETKFSTTRLWFTFSSPWLHNKY